MSFRRWALIGGALIIVPLAALVIITRQLDAGSLARSLAQSVEASTGRQFTVGEARLSVLPRPAIVMTNVRFANAGWGSQPSFAEAGSVYAAIDLVQFIGGKLRIKRVELKEAKILFETDRDGNGNWRMGREDAAAPPSLDALDIDELEFEALQFTYRDGKTGVTTQVALDSASLSTVAKPGVLQIDAHGSYNKKKVDVRGTIGALTALMADTPAWPVDLEGKIGVAAMSVHGSIDVPRKLRGIKLKLNAQIPEFSDYIAQTGAKVPALGPLRGSTQLTGNIDALVFSEIDMELGAKERMRLAIRGELAGTLTRDGNYEWQSNGIDFDLQGAQFGELGQWYGKTLPAWGAYRISARVTGPAAAPAFHGIDAAFGGGARPELRLRGTIGNLRAASGIDLQVTASAGEWWRPALVPDAPPLPPFRASARVRDARQGYRIDDLELKIADSAVSASLTMNSNGPRLRISGKAASPLIDLSRLPRAPAGDKHPPPATAAPAAADRWKLADVDLDLKLARIVLPDGRQLQALHGRLALEDGQIKATAVQAGFGNATIKADGSIAEPEKLAGLNLKLALQGAELADFLKFFDHKLSPVGPFRGRAQIQGSLDTLHLADIDANVGKPGQNARFSGKIDDVRKWQEVQLAITASIADTAAAGQIFGLDIPRLPPVRASALVTGAQSGYTFNDLKLALGRSTLQGRIAYAPGETRPRVTANVSGPLIDLSELPSLQAKPDAPNPLLAADIDAEVQFNRVVLPDRRALGPVSGTARLNAGALELKQLAAAVDGASATFDGRIGEPLKPAQLDLTVNAQLIHGAGIAAFSGLQLKDVPAFSATGKLTDHPDGYKLTGLKLTGAATTLAGDLALSQGRQRMKLTARTNSPLLDLSSFIPPRSGATSKPPVAAGTRLIPDVPLPLDVLRAVDADLDLRFDTVKFGDAATLGPLLVRALIADGVLKAEPVQLTAQPAQTLSVSGTVDGAQSAWALHVEGKGIDFGALLTRFGRPDIVTGGNTDFALHLLGKGKSLAAILGSLNGDARLKVGPYRIHNFAVPLDGGTIMHMFGLANPFLKADPDTDVKCLTALVPIKNGIISSDRRVATETAKYNAVMSGSLNLRTEGLDLTVTPIVRGEVTTVVRLSGTLAAPVVSVNAVGAIAKSAASLGATVATLGAWWVADTLIKKTASDPSPCATALVQ